jgi:hypothetical protein
MIPSGTRAAIIAPESTAGPGAGGIRSRKRRDLIADATLVNVYAKAVLTVYV